MIPRDSPHHPNNRAYKPVSRPAAVEGEAVAEAAPDPSGVSAPVRKPRDRPLPPVPSTRHASDPIEAYRRSNDTVATYLAVNAALDARGLGHSSAVKSATNAAASNQGIAPAADRKVADSPELLVSGWSNPNLGLDGFGLWHGSPEVQSYQIASTEPTAAPQNAGHKYVIKMSALLPADDVFNTFKSPGMSAPEAPAAREGFSPLVILANGNPISQDVNSHTRTIVNTTLPGHEFYPGKVTIQVDPTGSDSSTITITGTGIGKYPLFNDAAGYVIFGGIALAISLGSYNRNGYPNY